MTREQYVSVMEWIRNKPYGILMIKWSGKGITYLTAFVYFAAGIFLVWQRDQRVIPLVVTPAVSFLLVSIFRGKYGAIRPYEKYGFVPLIPKETQGKSFPSRHVFSIFVIATVICYIWLLPGIILLLLGMILALLRVAMGVHFPKDVLAGALIGVVCGCVGMGVWQLL
ncbi:MAG: phosphatase PAP2 family protein [Lachnospiraceae bacterium]|nr:phosphatase PAP2 family protein [Lachnospiraceae bacterium]